MNLYSSVLIAATLLIAPGAIFYGHAQTAKQSPDANSALTLAANEDREIGTVEKLVVDAAEAMPVDRFNFSPGSLNIPAGEYKGVRTFAVEVKHIATSNYFMWSALTGEKLPDGLKDGNGDDAGGSP